MAETAAIVNLINSFAQAYSLEEADKSVQRLLSLFSADASFTDELVGSCTGHAAIEAALTELAGLKFLADTRHVPAGHVVTLADDHEQATVTSTTVVYWKCVPVMVVKWTDAVVKVDGAWRFQSRVADAVQKNLEMIGEMQLRGKKQYAAHKDEDQLRITKANVHFDYVLVIRRIRPQEHVMGGAVSELRGAIHTHVRLAERYAAFLEPTLFAVQFFLHLAESGEGVAKDRAVTELAMDVVVSEQRRLFEEASTEVELLVEHGGVMRVLLTAVASCHTLGRAPALDPWRRWYDPPWQHHKRMPQYMDVAEHDVPQFQVAVLRSSIRCLRLLMLCSEAQRQLELLEGPAVLHAAAVTHALDEYVQQDVKAIFTAVYGGENAVRRIALGNVAVVVEMMRENAASAIVQTTGVERLCVLLYEVLPLSQCRGGRDGTSNHDKGTNNTNDNQGIFTANKQMAEKRATLMDELASTQAVALVTETLTRFDETQYLRLYVHVCRFISFVALEETNAKLVGQHGGVEGAIRLLFKAREMQRNKRDAEKKVEAQRSRASKRNGVAVSTTPSGGGGDVSVSAASSSPVISNPSVPSVALTAPAPAPLTPAAASPSKPGSGSLTLASLAVVEFTPTEIGQLALWALDLLATMDFNVSVMKLHRLKYLLEEIRLDPDGHALGSALIVTRRLRLIRWEGVGLPPSTTKTKHVVTTMSS